MIIRKFKIIFSLFFRSNKVDNSPPVDRCPYCDGTGITNHSYLIREEYLLTLGHRNLTLLKDLENTRCYACGGSGSLSNK